MTQAEMKDDVAFLRTVAEAGLAAPYIGGKEMVSYGLVTALAFLGHWSIGTFDISQWAYFVLWIVYGVCMAILGRVMRNRAAETRGAGALVNRVDAAVWAGVSMAILTFVLGTLAYVVVVKDPSGVNWILPASFSLYGAALYTTGKIGDVKTLITAAFLSFASAFCTALLVNDPNIYLYAAGAIIASNVLPGFILATAKPTKIG